MSHELLVRILPDGREAHVIPLTFGRARICLVDGYLSYGDVW